MQINWTIVLNDVVIWVGFIGGLIGLNKRFPGLIKAEQYVVNHAGAIAQTAETIAKDIAATPAGAIAAHSLHVEVDKVTEQFKKSEIARLALVGLHSFGQAYDSLSDTQKVALTKFVVDTVPKEWNIDAQVVIEILAEAEKAVEAFGNLGLVQAANTFTEAQKASVVAPTDPVKTDTTV